MKCWYANFVNAIICTMDHTTQNVSFGTNYFNNGDHSTIDKYYHNLELKAIEEEVEILQKATIKEIYDLIRYDPKHYVSIIAFYDKIDLQKLTKMNVKRIEGHLDIQFRFDDEEEWTEIGFFDSENTDNETLKELQNVITCKQKTYDCTHLKNRQRIAHASIIETSDVNKPVLSNFQFIFFLFFMTFIVYLLFYNINLPIEYF